MFLRKCQYKVFLYKNDYDTMRTEVLRHQHIETGGNLFGLWTTSGNVVVHVVLGPGRDCRRTNVSFHQDIKYMERVGRFLNDKFMLCHIGEWHSHHRLSLDEPSSGDKRTVRENYPEGMTRFLVIIGNIVADDQVALSPYFFSENGETCEKGKLELLQVDSPFLGDPTIVKNLKQGVENHELQPAQSAFVNSCQTTAEYQPATGGDHQRTQESTDRPSAFDNHSTVVKTRSDSPSERNSSANSQLDIPPRDYENSSFTMQPLTGKSFSNQTSTEMTSRYISLGHTEGASTSEVSGQPSHILSTDHPSSSNLEQGSEVNKQTRKEMIMKRVFDEIKAVQVSPVIECGRSGAIEMKFQHNTMFWMIRFPQSFPQEPAELFRASTEKSLNNNPVFTVNRNSLNNHINILLAIKRKCSPSPPCPSCEKITAHSLACSDPNLNLFVTEEGNTMLESLCDTIKSTIADTESLKKQIKHFVSQHQITEPSLELSFTHSSKTWYVEVNSTFPACDTIISCAKQDSTSNSYYLRKNFSREKWECDVFSTITKRCCCEKCKSFE